MAWACGYKPSIVGAKYVSYILRHFHISRVDGTTTANKHTELLSIRMIRVGYSIRARLKR